MVGKFFHDDFDVLRKCQPNLGVLTLQLFHGGLHLRRFFVGLLASTNPRSIAALSRSSNSDMRYSSGVLTGFSTASVETFGSGSRLTW